MNKFYTLLGAMLLLTLRVLFAQVPQPMPSGSVPFTLLPHEEPGGGCSTPDLDSAQAVALPYYGNNQVIENYLIQNGYDKLPYISFPSSPALRSMSSSASFLEPNFLIPINVYIYRDGDNNPNSSVNEDDARDFVCRVNTIYRDAGTAIQFYVNRVEFEANNFFNQEVSSNLHVYDLWFRKRFFLIIVRVLMSIL